MSDAADRDFGRMAEDENVRKLVDLCCDGLATDEQRKELGERIKESPEVRDYYISHSFLISQMLTYADAANEPAMPAPKLGHRKSVPKLAFPRLLAIAASLALCIAGGSVYLETIAPSSQVAVGRLRQLNAGPNDWQTSVLNARERIDVKKGTYEVVLDNGVKISLAGPASFTIEDPMRFRLAWGRITADVPKQANGFRVLTYDADVVDHGTRFGVAVVPGAGTDVAVFEGRVNVGSISQRKDLTIGKAVSVSNGGQMSRMTVVRPNTFNIPREAANSQGPLITSVSDNIRDVDEMGFYRIVNQGFDEDQPAYVDRVHQWNGVDKNGLPKELIGADYVMPFNEDKFARQIEVAVTLSRLADVYVLLDKRAEVPEWLEKDFDDTGLAVGIDEGERPGRPEDPRTIAKKAGNSIDYVFAVWKRKSPAIGEVTFNGMDNGNNISMYGILAVPRVTPPPSI